MQFQARPRCGVNRQVTLQNVAKRTIEARFITSLGKPQIVDEKPNRRQFRPREIAKGVDGRYIEHLFQGRFAPIGRCQPARAKCDRCSQNSFNIAAELDPGITVGQQHFSNGPC